MGRVANKQDDLPSLEHESAPCNKEISGATQGDYNPRLMCAGCARFRQAKCERMRPTGRLMNRPNAMRLRSKVAYVADFPNSTSIIWSKIVNARWVL